MNDIPEMVPLNENDLTTIEQNPKILFFGFSESDISFYIDLILREGKHLPIFAMINQKVLDWTLREYLETITKEHLYFSTLNKENKQGVAND